MEMIEMLPREEYPAPASTPRIRLNHRFSPRQGVDAIRVFARMGLVS